MELQLIQSRIVEVRGYRVLPDFYLAELYGVKTKALKQAVKRNLQRFPPDFMFELSEEEWKELVTICDQFPSNLKHSYINPMVFTEQGVAMLSSVLKSQTAIDVNISIMRAFVLIRQMAVGYDELLKRMEELEENTDAQFNEIYQALTQLLSKPDPKPRKPIGYRVPDN
ncbi:ORF6N domain protein [Bacteroidales bacterium Barb6]|nr:ORF6N domain protein [Bacteroidales bacterium Barb6]OAV72662.1 ORF6N domain protein [Bacteroidales bacterium Barb6]